MTTIKDYENDERMVRILTPRWGGYLEVGRLGEIVEMMIEYDPTVGKIVVDEATNGRFWGTVEGERELLFEPV
jgi:hypothetical protein